MSEPEARVILPDRTTRGRRLRSVVDEEEAEADEAFWGQAALAESDGDEGYSSQASSHSSGEDVPDSDFFDSENDISDGEDLARGEAEEAVCFRAAALWLALHVPLKSLLV